MDHRNRQVIDLAAQIGRSANAVALKLSNFASLDPDLRSRGISGMSHRSSADAAIWEEFAADREALIYESEQFRAARLGQTIEEIAPTADLPPELEGREREAVVRVRVNQQYFRRMILARYDAHCCITGLAVPQLLTASHIVPWAEAPELRLNPRNGLCLNALHDRAFDTGLLTVSDDFKVQIDSRVQDSDSAAADFLLRFHGSYLKLPDNFEPAVDLLRRHRERSAMRFPALAD